MATLNDGDEVDIADTLAMTGWRLGYAAGPKEFIAAMSVVHSQSTSNPSSISQWAAVEAHTGSQEFLTGARDNYLQRRDALVAGLKNDSGHRMRSP